MSAAFRNVEGSATMPVEQWPYEALMQRSGFSGEEFASAIGTSRSRLSTYASGKVVPAATLLVRMETLASSPRTRRVTRRPARGR